MTEPGLRLITRWEGYRKNAYPDPIHGWSVPTIGYGTTVYQNGQKVRPGDQLNETKAKSELILFVDTKIRPALEKIPGWSAMNDLMRGALESFAYNLGAGFYGHPDFETITRVLKNREWDIVPRALTLYCNPYDPSVTDGLRRRRQDEGNSWLSGLKLLGHNSPDEGHSIYLPAMHYSQRDSRLFVGGVNQAGRMCCCSSNAMLTAMERPNVLGQDPNGDDNYYRRLLQLGEARGEKWDTTNQDHQLATLRYFKLNAVFSRNCSIADIDRELERGKGFVAGLLHHGPVFAPYGGGHYMFVHGRTGKESDDFFVVNDPWGRMNIETGEYDPSSGKDVHYSRRHFQRRFEVTDAGEFAPGRGWGFYIQ